MCPRPSSLVLDVGATPDKTLPESNFFERYYPYKKRLVVTSIEDASFLQNQYPGIIFVRTEKMELPFADNTFDIVFCSAVLEHVGCRFEQKHFIEELLRVAKYFFIVTPNRYFPVEFHTLLPFIHWLPQYLHQSILTKLGLKFWSQTENLNLLDTKDLLNLFQRNNSVQIVRQRLLGICTNLIVYG